VDVAVLILNGGSSSWKISLYDDVAPDAAPVDAPLAEAELSWPTPGDPEDARLEVSVASARQARRPAGGRSGPVAASCSIRVRADGSAIDAACDALAAAGAALEDVRTVGHRIVHGGALFTQPVRVDENVETGLRSLAALAPSHNARELAGIDAARRRFPGATQIAAFDTSFHRTLAPEAYVYPGPYAWFERGIRRFGFHGLSVGYCIERAAQLLGRETRGFNAIVAHLGGGCSATAVRAGASIDTSMGFTPLDGTMMGTRSGAVDPGILTYLLRDLAARGENTHAAAGTLQEALEREAGLFGISGISADVRELETAAARGDARATLALDLFAHRAAATIAGMAASLDRLDVLVFTGGIGEHAADLRARICARLTILGVALDSAANRSLRGEGRIDASGPAVLVVQTREEWYVARECARVL
jgi:acetate kinase